MVTSFIILILFIVLQQVIFLVALNKIDKLQRKIEIYINRLNA